MYVLNCHYVCACMFVHRNMMITAESTPQQVQEYLQSLADIDWCSLETLTGMELLDLSEQELIEVLNNRACAILLYRRLHPGM